MADIQNHGQTVGRVTTTFNGEKFKSMSMKTAALSCLMARCARSSRKSLILLLQRIG